MLTSVRVVAAAVLLLFLLHFAAQPLQRKKKKEEDFTQTLEVLPDPPAAIPAETARLSFIQAPLSARGLLSQQTRDTLKSLISLSRGAQFIQIRAYVAGTGDLRRIQSIVAEEFTERRLSLPVLTVVQVGALPMEGAQVQLEATLQERKSVNPAGVVFAAVEDADPRHALQRLSASLSAAGAAADPLRLTCAATAVEALQPLRDAAAAAFPKTLPVFHQSQRISSTPSVACNAVSRLAAAVTPPVRYLPGAVAVSAPRLVFAGAQLAFRYQEADARLAFQRLEKTLQAASSSLKFCVSLNTYPLSPQIAGMVRKVRSEFIDAARPPTGVLLPYEGLPSLDAAFALEAVVLPAAGS